MNALIIEYLGQCPKAGDKWPFRIRLSQTFAKIIAHNKIS